MTRVFTAAKAILWIVVLCSLVSLAFPAPRAVAQGILSVVTGTPGTVAPSNALQTGGLGFNGTMRTPRYCDKVAQISTTIGAGVAAIQVVALAAAQNIYVCGYQLGVSTAVAGTALTWVEGTGALCVTGQTTVLNPVITTPTSAPTTPNVTFGPVGTAVPFTLTAGDALCLKQAVTTNATTVTGWIAYTQD